MSAADVREQIDGQRRSGGDGRTNLILIDIAETMERKYDGGDKSPYMAVSNGGARLNDYVRRTTRTVKLTYLLYLWNAAV